MNLAKSRERISVRKFELTVSKNFSNLSGFATGCFQFFYKIRPDWHQGSPTMGVLSLVQTGISGTSELSLVTKLSQKEAKSSSSVDSKRGIRYTTIITHCLSTYTTTYSALSLLVVLIKGPNEK